MTDPRLRARYGLKYNPFDPQLPTEDIWSAPGFELFASRIESLTRSGGFAMLTGDVGAGKSKAFQALSGRLSAVPELVVGVMERPQSSPSDFYRELGRLFAVDLSPANRYGGFRALRSRWESHLQTHLRHPVLLIDEAQEMPTACLSELRLLGSVHFDSRYLLTVVLAGDARLPERFRTRELQPLGSRIRTRLALPSLDKNQLRELLEHLLDRAGNPGLVTESLKDVLVKHSAGNPRVMCNIGAELLVAAVQDDVAPLDDALFLRVFGRAGAA
jgi:type II secretory pathway predicted ATPase ExeA